jgi:L-threonylcarbamoyladenylate synthase
VAFPTETVYGLGVHALDAAAVRRLFAAKGRPAGDPLIVHVASFDDMADLLGEDLETGPYSRARRLAAHFWPGPLTLVLPKSDRVPPEVTAGLATVAIRVPAHPVARELLEAVALPIAAPSANLFSRPSPTRAEHVLQDLEGRIDLVIDGGATDVGVESTVLDLTSANPTVLRPGAVTLEMLRELLPNVCTARQDLEVGASDEGRPKTSPGMMPKHYAPRAPLTLFSGNPDAALDALVERARNTAADGRRVGVLVTREDVDAFGGFPVQLAEMGTREDLAGIAARLYAALRQLDAAGVDLIFARDVGADDGLGRAIRDRLRRAASEHVHVD